MERHKTNSTSWQKVSGWYREKQGLRGSYYYRSLILPKTLKLLDLQKGERLLDLGCGQGVLERAIAKDAYYVGIDLARDLISYAQNNSQNPKHAFYFGDITKKLPLSTTKLFDKMAIILTLQNLGSLEGLFLNIKRYLAPGGAVVMVLNHPYYRIPRQTAWEIDEANKQQYRRINRYQTYFKVPIEMNPGSTGTKTLTWSFHYPLWQISQAINQAGLAIFQIEEWVSDKKSVGKASQMENFARAEIPLFMALKLTQIIKP